MSRRNFALIALEAYSAAPDIGVADSASRAIIRDTKDGRCIAFRGTDDAAAFIRDMQAISTTTDEIGRVHYGFWKAWQAISNEVIAAVSSKPGPFIFTGHSLGAALALIAGAVLTKAEKPPAAIYGFEPPRVSPDINIMAILIDVPVYLTRKGNDYVTEVPWFWHHGALLDPIGTPCLPVPNLEDHAMVGVVQALPSNDITSA